MKGRSANHYPTWSMDLMDGAGNDNANVCRFTSTGFTVWGNSPNSNASGVVYNYIAIKDAYQRVFKYGIERFWSGRDDIDVPLAQAGSYTGFTPELVIMNGGSRTTSINASRLRWGNHTGDQANYWNATASSAYSVADYIQSMGSDAIQFGNMAGAYSPEWINWLAIRDTAFNSSTLWQIFSYTGNGAGARNISLPAAMSAAAIEFIMVQPLTEPTGSGSKSGYIATLDNTAGQSKSMGTGGESTYGITDITTAGQFTVAGDVLNSSGIEYGVWVIVSGTDPATVPTDMVFPPTPGSIPPWDVTWPDDLPGLLGVKFYTIPYDPGAVPIDPWEYRAKCEQRQFPVDVQAFEFDVPCEQRQFDAFIGDHDEGE